MTDQPTTTPDAGTVQKLDATPKPAPRKAPARKAPAKKKEFAPVIAENGRMDHSGCGHPRDMKGRAACRAAMAKAAAK